MLGHRSLRPSLTISDLETRRQLALPSSVALRIQTLEAELATNPSNYDANVQMMGKMANIEKLRRAREAMSKVFPLTPSMWQEWAEDEVEEANLVFHR
ncbi:hypothetical protein ACLB2K_063318 [Fragaria x ananassa]